MDKERFKLCVRTYYPFAEFYDENELKEELDKDEDKHLLDEPSDD